MKKKQIILPKLKYQGASESDINLHIGFNEEKSLLRTDDRDIVLDLSERFETERSESNRYKIYGKIKMIFKNLYSGTTTDQNIKLYLHSDGSDLNFGGYLPYNEFAFLRRDVRRETTQEIEVNSMDEFTGFTKTMSGSTGSTLSSIDAPYHNWQFYLTYVNSNDFTFPMKYTLTGDTKISFYSGDGIPFRVEIGDTEYILTSPVKHGISQGEYVIINNVPFYVNSIGNEIYDSGNYVINILRSQASGTTIQNNVLVMGKRCTDIKDIENSTSQYYVHNHKILTNTNDYIIDKVGFESTIFKDEQKLLFVDVNGNHDVLVERNRMESILFEFKEPFILSGITNNLGYTPTEVYLTTIFKNGNKYFQCKLPYQEDVKLKVGYSFNLHDTWIDEHFSGDTVVETGITFVGLTNLIDPYTNTVTTPNTHPRNTLSKDNTLWGAFVEYDPKEMKERIISESLHKMVSDTAYFNHGQTSNIIYSGASVNNPIGLYYQPHHRIKLRELSPYIETSDTDKIDNLPENARYFPNEKLWKWRDLYDLGYIDPDGYGVDYPFLNNSHYVKNDINFYLRNEKAFTTKKDGIINFNLSNEKNKTGDNILGC
jgi:hypothetical protein